VPRSNTAHGRSFFRRHQVPRASSSAESSARQNADARTGTRTIFCSSTSAPARAGRTGRARRRGGTPSNHGVKRRPRLGTRRACRRLPSASARPTLNELQQVHREGRRNGEPLPGTVNRSIRPTVDETIRGFLKGTAEKMRYEDHHRVSSFPTRGADRRGGPRKSVVGAVYITTVSCPTKAIDVMRPEGRGRPAARLAAAGGPPPGSPELKDKARGHQRRPRSRPSVLARRRPELLREKRRRRRWRRIPGSADAARARGDTAGQARGVGQRNGRTRRRTIKPEAERLGLHRVRRLTGIPVTQRLRKRRDRRALLGAPWEITTLHESVVGQKTRAIQVILAGDRGEARAGSKDSHASDSGSFIFSGFERGLGQ